jgi:hypothetical protein
MSCRNQQCLVEIDGMVIVTAQDTAHSLLRILVHIPYGSIPHSDG